jgi:ribosomal protein L37AE/L43A
MAPKTSKKVLTKMRKDLDNKMNWKENYPKKKKKKSLKTIKETSQIVHKCPHCGQTGKGQSMFRWHFKRCPKKYETLLYKN